MAHTPGPWTVGEPDEDGDGVTIESQQGSVAFRVIDCSANLIAAAPDMLAALKHLLGIVDSLASEAVGPQLRNSYMSMGDQAREAIAKAEGRAK